MTENVELDTKKKFEELGLNTITLKKGTVFKRIPQGYSFEIHSLVFVDRPLLDDLTITPEMCLGLSQRLQLTDQKIEDITWQDVIVWLACEEGIIDLQGVKLRDDLKQLKEEGKLDTVTGKDIETK